MNYSDFHVLDDVRAVAFMIGLGLLEFVVSNSCADLKVTQDITYEENEGLVGSLYAVFEHPRQSVRMINLSWRISA